MGVLVNRIVGVMAVLALVIGACAPASPTISGSPPAATAAGESTTPSVSDKLIRFGSSASFTFLPIRIALDRGYFKAAGLTNATFTLIDSAANAANALAAGEIEFGGLAVDRAALATIAGKPAQCVMSIQDTPATALIVSSKSNIKPGDWAALKGKTIGIALGGTSEVVAKYFVTKNGLINDVKFTNTANTAAQLAALQSGAADAVSVNEPAQSQAILEGVATMFFDLPAQVKTSGWPLPYIANCLQAKTEYAKANPAVVKAAQQAIVRALADIRANPTIAIDFAAKESPGTSQAVIQRSINTLINTFSADGVITEAAYKNAAEHSLEYKLIPRILPYADMVYTAK